MKQLPSTTDNRIETLLIAGAIIPQLLGFILKSDVDSYLLFAASYFFLLVLIGYYTYLFFPSSKKTIALLLLALALAVDIYLRNEDPIFAARIVVRCLFGIWMMVFAVRQILKTKSFEMLAFIAALFLMLNAVLFTSFAILENVEMIVLFGSAFSLATLVYYENLWDQYDTVEKKGIIVCLLTLLIDVFFLSKELF